MEGKIVNFDAESKKGKIKLEDGKTRVFNIEQWFEEYLPEKGMIVKCHFNKEKKIQKIKRFGASAKQKAKKKKDPAHFEWKEPLDFVMRREDKPKYGIVFGHYKKIKVTTESPSLGKQKLKEIVQKHGGNALLGLTVEKGRGSRGTDTGGTYYYTIYTVSGYPAFIASKRKTKKDNLKESQEKMKLNAEKFVEEITEYYNPYTKSGLWEKNSDMGRIENIVRFFFNK